jgi:DNA repair protein RecO (recombination protein O)
MAHYRDEGVVLRTYPLGEADRIVVFASRDNGKVRAVAKGVRRTKSRLGGRLEPLSRVSMLLWRGRNLDTVSQVEVVDAFSALRSNLVKISAASQMAEAMDRLCQQGRSHTELYEMFVRALSTLRSTDSPLVVPAFFLKALAADGVGPVLEGCVRCGSEGPLKWFDPGEGGVLCARCRRGSSVSQDSIQVMQKILSGGLASVLSSPWPESVVSEVRHLATVALEHHVEARMLSVSLADRV